MTLASATASISPASSPARRWPMTATERLALEAEIARLAMDAERLARQHLAGVPGEEASQLMYLSVAEVDSRRERLRAVLAAASIVDDPDRVVIGRSVSLREDDGTRTTYTIVSPGDGAPSEGRIAADSPLGRAVLNSLVGERAEVDAPAGRRIVSVEWVG